MTTGIILRFRKAERILLEGRYFLEVRGNKGYYFKVKGDSGEEHDVIISEDKVSCTCPDGSYYGVKKALPCSHLLACLGAMMHVQGPLITRKWWKNANERESDKEV